MTHSRLRRLGLVLVPLVLVAPLGFWARHEARSQANEVEEALRSQATLLAHTLAPALAAAAASASELDELLAWKLLDNARLIARLDPARFDDPAESEAILEGNGLDAVVWFGADGAPTRRAGRAVPFGQARSGIDQLLRGEADELLLGSLDGTEGDYVASAVRAPDGGGVIATVADAAKVYAFSRQIGVSNLLDGMVETPAVLYLVYREQPDGWVAEATWDGAPAPAPLAGPRGEVRGRAVFEVTVPVASPADRRATLRAGLDGVPLDRATGSALRRTALVGSVLAALGLGGVAFALLLGARERERRDAALRLRQLEEERRRSDRLAAAGALAAGLAHEVRNPLNAIGLAAQQTERLHPDGGPSAELAARIRAEVARLESSLQGFLTIARPSEGPRRDTDLGALVRDAVKLLELEAAEKGVSLRAGGGAADAVVDPEALRGAVVNLLRNAIQASPNGGVVEARVERRPANEANGRARPGEAAWVVVRDAGEGIDPALAGRLFEPFVTTRAEGTGLGLAIVRRVAEEHGGHVRLANLAGGGAEATLELPLRGDDA